MCAVCTSLSLEVRWKELTQIQLNPPTSTRQSPTDLLHTTTHYIAARGKASTLNTVTVINLGDIRLHSVLVGCRAAEAVLLPCHTSHLGNTHFPAAGSAGLLLTNQTNSILVDI